MFHRNADFVYRLLPTHDPSLGLLPTPEVDVSVSRVPSELIGLVTSRAPKRSFLAIDGDPKTRWTTFRSQWPGDWVEFVLQEPRAIAAIEFTHFLEAFDAPLAFKIDVSDDGQSYRTVFVRRRLRIFSDQIHRPAEFTFRVVLPEPARAHRVRMTLLEEVPGRWWSIHEAVLWERKPSAAPEPGARAGLTTAAGG